MSGEYLEWINLIMADDYLPQSFHYQEGNIIVSAVGVIGNLIGWVIYYLVYESLTIEIYKPTISWLISSFRSIITTFLHRRFTFSEFSSPYLSSLFRTYISYTSLLILLLINFSLNEVMNIYHHLAWLLTLAASIPASFILKKFAFVRESRNRVSNSGIDRFTLPKNSYRRISPEVVHGANFTAGSPSAIPVFLAGMDYLATLLFSGNVSTSPNKTSTSPLLIIMALGRGSTLPQSLPPILEYSKTNNESRIILVDSKVQIILEQRYST